MHLFVRAFAGLQPKNSEILIEQELRDWANSAWKGTFTPGIPGCLITGC